MQQHREQQGPRNDSRWPHTCQSYSLPWMDLAATRGQNRQQRQWLPLCGTGLCFGGGAMMQVKKQQQQQGVQAYNIQEYAICFT